MKFVLKNTHSKNAGMRRKKKSREEDSRGPLPSPEGPLEPSARKRQLVLPSVQPPRAESSVQKLLSHSDWILLPIRASLVAQWWRIRLQCRRHMWKTHVRSLGREYPLKEMATNFSILAWKIPRTEEPCALQFLGYYRNL